MNVLLAVPAWLAGTRAGRIVLAGLLAAAVLGLALLRAFSAGTAAERLARARSTLDAIQTKVATDEALRRLSPAARRERLRQWTRGG